MGTFVLLMKSRSVPSIKPHFPMSADLSGRDRTIGKFPTGYVVPAPPAAPSVQKPSRLPAASYYAFHEMKSLCTPCFLCAMLAALGKHVCATNNALLVPRSRLNLPPVHLADQFLSQHPGQAPAQLSLLRQQQGLLHRQTVSAEHLPEVPALAASG